MADLHVPTSGVWLSLGSYSTQPGIYNYNTAKKVHYSCPLGVYMIIDTLTTVCVTLIQTGVEKELQAQPRQSLNKDCRPYLAVWRVIFVCPACPQ